MLKFGPYVDLLFAICYHMLDNIWATYNLVVFENTQHMGLIWAAYVPHMGCRYVAHMWPIYSLDAVVKVSKKTTFWDKCDL